jgi:hypothetical protein
MSQYQIKLKQQPNKTKQKERKMQYTEANAQSL